MNNHYRKGKKDSEMEEKSDRHEMTESTKKEMEEWGVESSGKMGKRDLGSHGPE
jgi:hypothetical protein